MELLVCRISLITLTSLCSSWMCSVWFFIYILVVVIRNERRPIEVLWFVTRFRDSNSKWENNNVILLLGNTVTNVSIRKTNGNYSNESNVADLIDCLPTQTTPLKMLSMLICWVLVLFAVDINCGCRFKKVLPYN